MHKFGRVPMKYLIWNVAGKRILQALQVFKAEDLFFYFFSHYLSIFKINYVCSSLCITLEVLLNLRITHY